MRSRRSRSTSALAALVTAAALGVPLAAHAAASDAAAPTATPVGSGAATVVLPTGDRLTVRTDGSNGLTVNQDAAASGTLASFQAGADRYVIPAEAAPYAGRVLDLSLFDVTKLAATAGSTEGHIPVQLRFAAGVTPTAPAGVTFTAVSGQTATGYLTPDSGHAFAQALRDAVKADLAAGKPAGTGTLFGGLTSMMELGASTPVQPHYPLHILQINALDDTGAPGNMPIFLVNTDNARAFDAQVSAYNGIGKVAVPAGHYAAIGVNFAFDQQAHTSKTEMVTVEGITVPDSGTVPAATVDARTATSPITFTTQKPSTPASGFVQIVRKSVTGGGTGIGVIGGGTTLVTPTPKPTTGSLSFTVNYVGSSPASAASPYRYNLAVTSDHIDANQAYAPADSTLATLNHTINLDPHYGTTPADLGSAFVTPDGWVLSGLPAPGGTVTEYITGGLQWFSEEDLPFIFDPTNPVPSFGVLDDDVRLYRAGQIATRTWAYAPMAPNFGQHPAGGSTLFGGCQACSSGGNLDVLLGMLGDSNKDTAGLDFGAAGTSQLYVNGQLISSDTNHFGYVLKNLPAEPAKIRTVFDYDRTASGITQSTKTHTDVTIPYSGQDDPWVTLPAGTGCAAAPVDPATGLPTASCSILPALTLNYQFNALDSHNTSHSPMQNVVLHVDHLSYGWVGSHAPIDSAQVSVSFDNGATWKDVPTHGFNGTYAAHWANPAAGSPVELKVTATDCLGGSITQTITNPYTVG